MARSRKEIALARLKRKLARVSEIFAETPEDTQDWDYLLRAKQALERAVRFIEHYWGPEWGWREIAGQANEMGSVALYIGRQRRSK
jgi:hypothetical protein